LENCSTLRRPRPRHPWRLSARNDVSYRISPNVFSASVGACNQDIISTALFT
jgi:hypothetical protein